MINTGITLSEEQLKYAEMKVKEADFRYMLYGKSRACSLHSIIVQNILGRIKRFLHHIKIMFHSSISSCIAAFGVAGSCITAFCVPLRMFCTKTLEIVI